MIHVIVETQYDMCDYDSSYTHPIAAGHNKEVLEKEVKRLESLETEPTFDNPFYSHYTIETVPEILS